MTATPSADDFGPLLQPIAPNAPAGTWVRDDPIYRELVLARRMEDPALPQGVWKHDVKRPNWGTVSTLASQILKTRCKDLQAAVWLLEADIRHRGIGALAPGLSFIAALCRTFWSDLQPPLDKSDPDVRNAPLHWLNETLPAVLRQLPITYSGATGEIAYTWTDLINAQRHESVRLNDARAAERAEEGGHVTMEAFNVSATMTQTSTMRRTRDACMAADLALAELQGTLDELEGGDAPSLAALSDIIGDMANWADSLLPPDPASAPPEGEMDMPADPILSAEPAGYSAAAANLPATGLIANREDAYRRLSEAADYLLRTERHSPVPYIIRRAIAWGDLPLDEIVAELSDLSRLLSSLELQERS